MVVKKIPGLPDKSRIFVCRTTADIESLPALKIDPKGTRWAGLEAASLMEDGALYFVPVYSSFVWRTMVSGRFTTIGVSIKDLVQSGGKRDYKELAYEIATYLNEGLHPDAIFDIILL